MMAEYTAFDTRYGLTLSAGDLDGDWRDELIVGMGPDPKNSGILKVLKYRGDGFTELMSQTLYSDRTYGINTTTGDIDGDGLPEIITTPGPGPNSPATVTVWKYTTDGLTEHFTFTAFDGMYGANVATGDIDGDGLAEIITGSGPDPKNTALVRVYKPDGTLVNEFTPYPAKHNYGTTVSAGDLDSDGVSEIVTGLGPGPQNEPLVKIFESDGTETGSLTAYPGKMGYGVNVSIGRTGSQ
ncbi:MAG TPA: hypothetical protein DCO77_00320 [Nitrospiraceae bacterium]|nr:hypothetical protein [Nitrospiraceae bacterium]